MKRFSLILVIILCIAAPFTLAGCRRDRIREQRDIEQRGIEIEHERDKIELEIEIPLPTATPRPIYPPYVPINPPSVPPTIHRNGLPRNYRRHKVDLTASAEGADVFYMDDIPAYSSKDETAVMQGDRGEY